MIHSKRSQEGYLLVDHRMSPGITEADLATVPESRRAEFRATKGMFEAPTLRCSHCGTIVIINPDRTRERAYCARCDHYICDPCSLNRECHPLMQRIDEKLEQAAQLINIKEV